MKRLCGLMMLSMGSGMTLILVFPKNFFWVSLTIMLLIMGYHMFCH